MKAVKLLLLAASALCLTHPKGPHGKGFGLNKPGKKFGPGPKKMFGGKPHKNNKFPHFPRKNKGPKDNNEEIKQQLNVLLEPKYDFLVEMRDKLENEGLTEDELRGVIQAVPELKYLDGYVDDLMQNQQDGKVGLNNLQEKTDDLTE